ncbi:MAG: hypothetical protein AB7P04_10275 [Bacteriovoracia bacterium]
MKTVSKFVFAVAVILAANTNFANAANSGVSTTQALECLNRLIGRLQVCANIPPQVDYFKECPRNAQADYDRCMKGEDKLPVFSQDAIFVD